MYYMINVVPPITGVQVGFNKWFWENLSHWKNIRLGQLEKHYNGSRILTLKNETRRDPRWLTRCSQEELLL